MAIMLGPNQYGKAEVRLVRITGRDGGRHQIKDLNVSVTLAGDFADAHTTGDNSAILTTDAQKNTVQAFARQHGIPSIEAFGLRLARHFRSAHRSIGRARVTIEEYGWQRLGDHSFSRAGQEVRLATVTCDAQQEHVVSGLRDLVLLSSTDSEFWGFVKDRYTTLAETRERILATAVDARWRHDPATASSEGTDWDACYLDCRGRLIGGFTDTYSYSLQQTLHAMGTAVLQGHDEVAEIRLSLPNKHHFLVDLAPFGLDNPDEVYVATDRPYGLIEGTVLRDDAPPAPDAW